MGILEDEAILGLCEYLGIGGKESRSIPNCDFKQTEVILIVCNNSSLNSMKDSHVPSQICTG